MIDVKKLKKAGTINCIPTPTGYANALIAILENGNYQGKQWAREEIIKFVKAAATLNPDKWGKE